MDVDWPFTERLHRCRTCRDGCVSPSKHYIFAKSVSGMIALSLQATRNLSIVKAVVRSRVCCMISNSV